MTEGYNERLFGGRGLRSFLHNARFFWFERTLKRLGVRPRRVVEIGCFDGRLLGFFPKEPDYYQGFDAGWEGGLASAQERFKNDESRDFTLAQDGSALSSLPTRHFDLGVALETIEHIPPELVDDYLRELARVVDGPVLITVPNEKGVVFLAKWIVKKVVFSSAEEYSLRELISATFGRLDRVERNEHKGFDYDVLIQQLSEYFEIRKVESIPFRHFPLALSFTLGIVATSRLR